MHSLYLFYKDTIACLKAEAKIKKQAYRGIEINSKYREQANVEMLTEKRYQNHGGMHTGFLDCFSRIRTTSKIKSHSVIEHWLSPRNRQSLPARY